jgi:hypothetical protein
MFDKVVNKNDIYKIIEIIHAAYHVVLGFDETMNHQK